MQTFQQYLEQVCFEANPAVLDDDMADFFDNWLGSQNGEDYIRLANAYAKKVREDYEAELLVRLEAERTKSSFDDFTLWSEGHNQALDKAISIIKS